MKVFEFQCVFDGDLSQMKQWKACEVTQSIAEDEVYVGLQTLNTLSVTCLNLCSRWKGTTHSHRYMHISPKKRVLNEILSH